MAAAQKNVSFLDKLNLFRILSLAVIFALVKLVGAFLFPNAEYKGLGIKRSVYPSVLKFASKRIPSPLLKALFSKRSTRKSIEEYCANEKLELHSEALPYGAYLHWLGPRTSSKVLLFFHGGGYNIPIDPQGHIPFSLKMAIAADCSLAILEYTLATTAPYPIQLRQATAALSHLLASYPESNIIIAGDSAGGHLAAGLLSHLIHPSEKIDRLRLNGKLGGICFISPFLSFDYNKSSYKENDKHDYLTLRAVKRFNETFKPVEISDSDATKDPYLSPGDAPLGWWENAPVERLITLLGTWEVFADDCLAFGKRLQKEAGKRSDVRVVECDREFHDSAVIDIHLGLNEGEMARTTISWMEQFK